MESMDINYYSHLVHRMWMENKKIGINIPFNKQIDIYLLLKKENMFTM